MAPDQYFKVCIYYNNCIGILVLINIQGFVKFNPSNTPVERIRLIFYAVETIPPFDIAPGIMRTARNVLFSIQKCLWESNNGTLKLDENDDYSFPFTIQMPMVQLPPAIDHAFYRCSFQLIAQVDTTTEPIRAEKSVVCMPFVETRLLKSPVQWQAQKGHLSVRVNMIAQEFVPNEYIPIRLHLECNNKKSNSKSFQFLTVHLKLIQTLHVIEFDDIGDQVKTIASVSQKLPLISSSNSSGTSCDADLTLKLPADISPTYDYGKLVRISYAFRISAEQKGPMGGIWNYTVATDDIPITIGTLGYGIRSSNEIQLYSMFEQGTSNKPNSMPLPQFMKAIEYEDALPLYDSTKLPDYEHHVNHAMLGF
jgi:hypothetical protein